MTGSPAPGRVDVVGLGPAGPDLVTVATRDLIESVTTRFVRTTRHPAANLITTAGGASFDWLYDAASRIDDVYPAIVEELVRAATTEGNVLYAVPGSPGVAERSVELLRADPRVEVVVHPAVSFLDLAWTRLRIDPVDVGVRLIDGHDFAVAAAGERGPLLVVQCDSVAVLSEIKLAVDEVPTIPVTVLSRLGGADESITEVAWDDLDRMVTPDHLTSLYVPMLAAPLASELVRFSDLVRRLRAECPWDARQTHASLTRHLLEEAYEVIGAIEGLGEDGAGIEHLEEELGDLLFQVVFHATLGAEAGHFTLADVARGIHDKLVHRHPHVFAGLEVSGADEVVANWEQIKKAEKGRASVMDGIPTNLPSLLYAHKVQRKAASAGFETLTTAPIQIDLGALASAHDLGDALMAVVAASRRGELDPEAALRAAATRLAEAVSEQERSSS